MSNNALWRLIEGAEYAEYKTMGRYGPHFTIIIQKDWVKIQARQNDPVNPQPELEKQLTQLIPHQHLIAAQVNPLLPIIDKMAHMLGHHFKVPGKVK